MNAILYVSGDSTPHRLAIPLPGAAISDVFPWRAVSTGEDQAALRETIEILNDPEAMAELAAADEAIANGDVIRGTEAVRALRPRR